ncbi:MAG TPA: hypothetical protein VG826_20535 [Pirellulales bacterium]|nr:hypothetical protein [Pirellulales bacterium]
MFATLQLGLSVVMDEWLPVLHDAEYGCKLARLRQRQRECPRHSLMLILGSSRSGVGLDPESFPARQAADGRETLAFNFAITGCGPVQELQILKRLLRHGVRPERLLIEVHPLLLHQEIGASEESWLEVRRMDWRDVMLVSQFAFDRRGLIWRWCRTRVCPWYSNRFLILNRVARGWLSGQTRFDPWTGVSRYGWLPYFKSEVTPEEYQRGTEFAKQEYGRMFQDYRVTEPANRALEALLGLCRQEEIDAALFVMPEGSQFRSGYTAEARQQLDDYLAQIGRRWNVPVYDATTWCGDADFWDSHHLLSRGATSFSRRFGRQVVEEFVSRRSRAVQIR